MGVKVQIAEILFIVVLIAVIAFGVYWEVSRPKTTAVPASVAPTSAGGGGSAVATTTAAPTLSPAAAQALVQNFQTAALAAQSVSANTNNIAATVSPAITTTTGGVPTTTAPQISGRFVKISNPVVGCMNLTEVQIYSTPGGANLALGKSVSKSSGYPVGADTQPGNLIVDGDLSSYSQTGCGEAPWMMVDLGAVVPIYSVVVYNRMQNNCGTRTTGSIVTILDASGNTVYTSSPFPDQAGNTTMTGSCGTTLQPFATYFVLPPSATVNGTT